MECWFDPKDFLSNEIDPQKAANLKSVEQEIAEILENSGFQQRNKPDGFDRNLWNRMLSDEPKT